jgi:CO/xanthine dehydrogenase Mo-binding subunit
VPLNEVEVVQGDTTSSGFETGPSGSRLTTTIHQAINAAAEKSKAALRTLASENFGCAPADVRSALDGSYEAGNKSIDLKSLLAWATARGKAPLSHSGQNNPNKPADITCFAAQIAEVEVDRETGQVRINRVVTAHDVGHIINPMTHQGQIEGGVVQAIGQTMSEQLVLRDGAVVSASLGDYKLPTIMDIPDLETVLVSSDGPAKSIGEMSNVALPAAIANAVYDAVGVRLLDLPLSAEKIYDALRVQANEP